MAIIKCPECGHQISEKAAICPICGVEIAGKIAKCYFCGEVFFKDDGLCPHCYRPHKEDKASVIDIDSVEDDTTTLDESDTNDKDTPVSSISDVAEIEEAYLKENPTDAEEGKEEPVVFVETREQEPIENVEEIKYTDNSDNSDISDNSEQADYDITYIDTDGDNLQRPEHVTDESENDGGNGKHKFIPIVVSLAITALIAAVCLYFYNDSKLSKETQAFELAINSGDISQMNGFLRNYTYATIDHKRAIEEKIADITKQKDDLSLSLLTRDKDKLIQYLNNYPDTPQKQIILKTIDSLDWEDATKTNTKDAYDKYVLAHADGIFIKDAKERLSVKVTEGTEEDASLAKNLFREFFLSVNGNQSDRLIATLNSSISSFAGTANASRGDVVGWMNRQHKDDVSNVIWKLNHDYKITKRQLFEKKDLVVEFTAQKTTIYKDGHAATDYFKIKSDVSNNKKIASMDIVKYTPQKNNTIVAENKSSTSTSNKTVCHSTSGTSQQKTTANNLNTGTSQQKTTASTPKSGTSQQKTTASTPKSGTSQQKTTASNSSTGTSQPKATASTSKTGTSQQKTTASAPKSGTSQQKTTASTSKSGTSQSSNTSTTKTSSTSNGTQAKKTEQKPKSAQGLQTAQSTKTTASNNITASKNTSTPKKNNP